MAAGLPEIPEEADHFAVLGLPRRLRIDPALLRERFLERSRRVHPDRFAGAPPEEKSRIQHLSARVNDAHRVLSDPAARAEYLLALEGIERPEGEAKCPPDLLEEVFEIREGLLSGAGPGLAERVRALEEEARARLEELYDEHDGAAGEEERRAVLGRLREALVRRRFLANLVREVEKALGG